MEVRITIGAEIVERQELLNGTQTITMEGTSEDGAWTCVGSLSWNRGLVDYAGEGDLALTRGGDEIFATLTRADVSEPAEDAAADHVFRVTYDIDGGAGAFADAAGVARAELVTAGERVEGEITLSIDEG